MTLDELRAVVLTRRMLGQGIESGHGILWVQLSCPYCNMFSVYVALYNGRVHRWECQSCRHMIAEPAPLFDEWAAVINKSKDWEKDWRDCLERHKDDGR